MLYKFVLVFFAAAHGLPGAYKKRAKSASLHAFERTTGPKCCECEMSKQMLPTRIAVLKKQMVASVTASDYKKADKMLSRLISKTHCFEQAKSIREDGTKESCHATCKYRFSTYYEKEHAECSIWLYKCKMWIQDLYS